MNEEIILKGEWFLPNNIENKISGSLTYKPNEAYSVLELFGILNVNENKGNYDLILGNTLKGDNITLYKCKEYKSSELPSNRYEKIQLKDLNIQQSSSLYVEFIFNGAHIENLNDLVFQKAEIEIYNLEEWVGIEGFSDVSKDFIDTTNLKLDFNYLTPKPIEFKINDKLEGAFKFSLHHNPLSNFQKEYKFTQKTILSLTSNDYLSFSQFLESIYIFQNFLVISMYSHTTTLSVELFSDKFYKNIRIGIEDGYVKLPKKIKLYKRHLKKIERERPKTHYEMLFNYDDIKEDFPEIIANWFEKYNVLSSTFNLFFYQFYLNEKYIDVLFLNLAQAAETLHYHLNLDRKRIDVKEFKARKKILKSKLPDDLFSWINDQLSNNLLLDTRLNELIENYANQTLLNLIGDTKIFIKNVKDTRNYLTHFNPELEDKSLNGLELVELYEKLRLLLISAFLIEVGFDKLLVTQLFASKSFNVFNINP